MRFIFLVVIFCCAQLHAQDIDADLIKKMSLEQKVGQLFILGFMGTESSHSLDEMISTLHPGGILVFSRNIHTAKQTAQLLYQAQKDSITSSFSPLLIAVDQEGGDVIRIKTSPQLPSAQGLAVAGDESVVREAGLQTALLLKALGFNMNLAPVLDIADPYKDSFLGTRAFGRTPEIVSEMGLAFADGLRDGGVLPTAKHFPGHGGVAGDSHLVTPQKNIGLDALLAKDLIPYADLTKSGSASAVMVAHIAFPKIDGDLTPATYSKTLISDVLRTQLGFQGIVMTDDIEMGGAGAGSALEHAKRAINAGVDLVMMAWNKKLQHKVIHGVVAAVRRNEISMARIDESVLRLIKVKRQFASFAPPVAPDAKNILTAVRSLGIESVAKQTITKIFEENKSHEHKMHIDNFAETKFLIYSLNESFYRSFKSYKKLISHFEPVMTAERIDLGLTKDDSSYAVVYISGTRSARLVNSLTDETARRTILINAESQGLIRNSKRFADVVNVYFKHPDLGALSADYLFSLGAKAREPSSNH